MKTIFFICAAIVLSSATYKRNNTWQNEVSLWQDISTKSHKGRAFCNLGNSYIKSGSTEKAVVAYKKALEIDPEFAVANFSLGKICQSIGLFDQALEKYQSALKYFDKYLLDDDDPVNVKSIILNRIGQVYYELNLKENAEKEFRSVLSIDPHNSDAYYGLGLIYMDMGLWKNAILELERGAKQTEEHEELIRTLNLLGTAYARSGQIDKGIATFQEALKIDMNDAAARENLEETIMMRQQLEN